jgi:ribose 5-phosphate isomerase B
MKIYLAADHAGYELKEKIKTDLQNKGYDVKDFGANVYDADDDYPDYIAPCVVELLNDTDGNPENGVGIVFGGSGTGEAIVANKVSGARAVVYNGNLIEIVKLGRLHNNANVLSIGARFVKEEDVFEAIKIFLETKFEGGRHERRVEKIEE